MSEETIRLAIGLILLGAALVSIGIGLVMSEVHARAALQNSDPERNS